MRHDDEIMMEVPADFLNTTNDCNLFAIINENNENSLLEPEESLIEATRSGTTTSQDGSGKVLKDLLSIPSDSRSLMILKVHMENNRGFKSFKYDRSTCVRDVLNCLKEKLAVNFVDCYGLVIKSSGQNCVSSFVLLEETRHLYTIREQYGKWHDGDDDDDDDVDDDGGDANFQCLLRFIFVPSSYDNLVYNDENSFDYLYEQVKLYLFCIDILLKRSNEN